jgi:hypothetical protein
MESPPVRAAAHFLPVPVVLFLALLPSGCLQEPRKSAEEKEARALVTDPLRDPGRVLAEVNGQPITELEYYQRILRKFGGQSMIRGVIREELFFQEAKKRGITVGDQELRARVEELMAREAADAGGVKPLAEIYGAWGLTLDDLRRDYARAVEVHLVVGKVTKSLRRVDATALRAIWDRTYAKNQFRVRHIAYSFPLQGLPPVELDRRKALALDKAKRTAQRIRAGEDFAKIAREESDDVTRQNGGELGLIPEDAEMDPVMKEAILKLKPMEVSDPVENNLVGAFHVVQVTEVVEHKSFAESEPILRKELAERDPDEAEIVEAEKGLWSAAKIKILGKEVEPPKTASLPGKEDLR